MKNSKIISKVIAGTIIEAYEKGLIAGGKDAEAEIAAHPNTVAKTFAMGVVSEMSTELISIFQDSVAEVVTDAGMRDAVREAFRQRIHERAERERDHAHDAEGGLRNAFESALRRQFGNSAAVFGPFDPTEMDAATQAVTEHLRKVAEAIQEGRDPRSVVTDDPTGDKADALASFERVANEAPDSQPEG